MISAHLAEIQAGVNSNRREWFPMDKKQRKERNQRLGHELGYGLGMFDEWLTWAQTSYGRYIVANSLDSTGIVISEQEWLASIRQGVQKYRAQTRKLSTEGP